MVVKLDNINTLSKFGTSLDDENRRVKFTHLKTRYRVRFINFGVEGEAKNLTMDMQSCDAPKGDFKVEEIKLVNGSVYYPGHWTWSDVSFRVLNTYDNMNYKALLNQMQIQRDIYEQTTGDAPMNYKFTTVFEHTDGHQKTLSYWVMEGCFLTKAQPEGGDNQTHAPTMIDCTMKFDNASLYNADGIQIPTEDAGVVTDIASAFAF